MNIKIHRGDHNLNLLIIYENKLIEDIKILVFFYYKI
jgi:hypothetical protein